jgi:hypothetical protein
MGRRSGIADYRGRGEVRVPVDGEDLGGLDDVRLVFRRWSSFTAASAKGLITTELRLVAAPRTYIVAVDAVPLEGVPGRHFCSR